MSVKFLLLGGLMNGPLHGYMLKHAHFDQILKEFGINDGQLYPTLKKLENDALIEKEVIHQEGAPSRHMYTITEKGKKTFLKWLKEVKKEKPSNRYDFLRKDPFLSRSAFLTFMKKEEALASVKSHIRVIEKQIDTARFTLKSLKTAGLAGWKAKILEYGIIKDQAMLKWLNEFYDELLTSDHFTP